ncbi:MAG: S66 peptidase family protein [Flammeovirgaceae bacterium]
MLTSESRRKFLEKLGLASLGLVACSSFSGESVKKAFIRPKALKEGDTIGVIAPAGYVYDKTSIAEFEKILAKKGFKVVFGNTIYSQYGYFSGSDEFRAREVNSMFENPQIDGIIAMRGGWGCARILDQLDYKMIAKNPKVLMGYSDITALLIGIFAKTRMITFHGLMGYSTWDHFSTSYFDRIVMEGKQVIFQVPKDDTDHLTITTGKTKGRLVGGNLTVLSSMVGSEFLPEWEDKILFIEEIGEEPYRVDRMLTQLKLSGILNRVKGIIFGKCRRCDAEFPDRALTLEQVLEENFKDLKIPAFYGTAIGHIQQKFTFPIGIEVEMDADTGIIRQLESAVVQS